MFNSHRGDKPAGGRSRSKSDGTKSFSSGSRTGGRSGGRGASTGGRRGPGNRDKKYTNDDSDRPGFGRRNRGGPEMFRTTCDECGQSCEVPFKPTMGKPVFCRECFDTTGPNPERSGGKSFGKRDYKDFNGKGGEKSGGRTGAGDSNGPGSVSTAQFDKLNDKLDKILKLLSEKEEE